MARRQRVRQGARQAWTGVWHGHILVGTLVKAADGGIGFSYSPAWLASEDAFPVASVLPLVQGAQRGDLVLAAFDNLLPDAEGELRAKIAERVAAPAANQAPSPASTAARWTGWAWRWRRSG